MAYILKLKERPSQALRRILREQIGHSLQCIAKGQTDVVTGVHETRKAVKRIRALLRLVRSGLGESVFEAEDGRYRKIGRLLGGQRDRHVLIATLDFLEAEYALSDERQIVLVRLAAETQSTPSPQDADLAALLDKARRLLVKAERDAEDLKLDPDNFDTIGEGLERTLRRCRRAYDRVDVSDDPADWHEWRKTVQQHWRQMKLLERAWPDYFKARSQLAAELSDVLGRAQDLVVLERFLESTACSALAGDMRHNLNEMVAASMLRLREKAGPLGARLLAEGPGGLRRRASAYWRSSTRKLTVPPAKARVRPA